MTKRSHRIRKLPDWIINQLVGPPKGDQSNTVWRITTPSGHIYRISVWVNPLGEGSSKPGWRAQRCDMPTTIKQHRFTCDTLIGTLEWIVTQENRVSRPPEPRTTTE